MSTGKRVIVEVRWGPSASRKALVSPGGTLRVGRTDRADFVVPHDDQLSGVHFSLSWDGVVCRLQDEASAVGLRRNGELVAAAEVENGDWIRAGGTDFSVYFEGATPPRPAEGEGPEREAQRARALEALRAEPAPLFAVLDAARDDRVLELLRESPEEYRSLYEGVGGAALADVAPYLVALPAGSPLFEALVREGWGKSWGVFLSSRRPAREVRTHLRRFLVVEEDETDKRFYLRFYDPRVLRVLLPASTPLQREELFGEVQSFVVEDRDGAPLRFTAKE